MKKTLAILMILSLLLGCAPAFAEDGSAAELLTEAVLEALDNALYSDTYKALLEGDPIRSGSYGDAARGVQQTLADLGCRLSVDGGVGSQTISALKSAQETFGLEQTDTLDADGYAQLLLRLLAAKDFAAAEELLAGSMEDDELEFLRACSLSMQGKYYSAKQVFEECRFGNWEERAAACAQPWPGSGVLYSNPDVGGGSCQLIIQDAVSSGRAVYVKVYSDDDVLVRTMFTGSSGTAAASLPAGSYSLEYSVGDKWYGEEEGFGGDEFFSGWDSVDIETYHWLKLTIN